MMMPSSASSSALLLEQSDEWIVQRARWLPVSQTSDQIRRAA
jgi:hypothetical protein